MSDCVLVAIRGISTIRQLRLHLAGASILFVEDEVVITMSMLLIERAA